METKQAIKYYFLLDSPDRTWVTIAAEDMASALRQCNKDYPQREVEAVLPAGLYSAMEYSCYAVIDSEEDRYGKVNLFREIAANMANLYARKNADYGDSFGKGFAEYGMPMPIIRLEDKLNRIKSLTRSGGGANVNDESLMDTIMDLGCYAIMTLIELQSRCEE